MKLIAPAIALVLAAACTQIETATDQAGRDAARTILPETLAVFFPQVPKALYTPFTNCVVDNADASDVQSLAADALVGVDTNTADTVRTVLGYPDTQACLRAAAPQALGTL